MKVTLIYPRALAEPQGLSKVISLFESNLSMFKDYGIDMTVISRDTILGRKIVYNLGCNNCYPSILSKTRKWILNRIIKLSKSNTFFARLIINNAYVKWSKRAVNYYLSLNVQPDLILFHDSFTCFEYLKLGINDGPKTVCVIHSIGIPLYGLKIDFPNLVNTTFFKRLESSDSYVRNNVDLYGFVSKSSIDNFLCCYPDYPLNKLFFIHNGVPDIVQSKLKSKKDKLEICCVAGVNNYKGQEKIVLGVLKLREEVQILDRLHFTFVGDGDLKDELERLVMENNLSSYFSFAGQVNNVDDYLSKSDIFILPTSNDGLPMSIIEAMSASLPIVSTRIGGIPELIDDNVNGIFIDSSVQGVNDFINRIDNYNWAKMGEMSRKKYENEFTVHNMVKSYCKLFIKTLEP